VPTFFQRAVILIGLLAILIVQLCPMFEDPTPFGKVRQPLQPFAVVLMLFSAVMLLVCRRVPFESAVFEPSAPLLDLTCVRLC
jgi:hypothetical protein